MSDESDYPVTKLDKACNGHYMLYILLCKLIGDAVCDIRFGRESSINFVIRHKGEAWVWEQRAKEFNKL